MLGDQDNTAERSAADIADSRALEVAADAGEVHQG